MNQKEWEAFFPHEERTWEEFRAQYDLDGLQVPLEPRKKAKKEAHRFLGLMLALTAVIVICLVIVLGMELFNNDLNQLMGKS